MCRRDARIVDGSFMIPRTSAEGALAAARDFLDELGWEGALPDLSVVFRLFGVVAAGDPENSVTGLGFEGTLIEELEELFTCFAPHVRAGSYLLWQGDRGHRWRYDFDGAGLSTTPE